MRKGWDNVTHFQRIGSLNISGKANVKTFRSDGFRQHLA